VRRRRHPYLPRIAATISVLLILAAMAALWRYRPALPHISLSTPLTTAVIQEVLICVIWLLTAYILLRLLVRAAQVAIQGPAWQREAVLPGVIPAPPLPRPPTPSSERFQPPFKLILAPRPQPDTPATDVPATPQAETPAPQSRRPSPVPALSISLLGPLRIEGTKQPLKRAATRELIAYLALHPHGATRDELTEAVWPAQNPERILPRFWQSVTDARRALADAWVRDGEHYTLDRTRIRIDLDQLDRLLANTGPDDDEPHALEAALELWRGEPLEGSDYTWADGDIRRLTATYLGLLERAGHARLEREDARGALQMAEQAIALDQFHEASWRLALQAEHALGLRESITKRYDDLAHALDEQLGLQPMRETRVMYRQLLGQD
jgi:DNA-binding SARP family transcriptional activator